MTAFKSSELTLDSKGKVYHLGVGPDDIADDVILVGDPARVQFVASYFESREFEHVNREFATITGEYKGKRFTVMSTGIGTDNIDIVLNEIDAAVNIDLEKRVVNDDLKSLNFIRIGTCGALQEDIEPGSYICSRYAVGLDGLAHFYQASYTKEEQELQQAFVKQAKWIDRLNPPYVKAGSVELIERVGEGMEKGITTTANGFYGPQGRAVRLGLSMPDFKEDMRQLEFNGSRATNLEMETSGLYFMADSLGHSAVTVCLVLANRYSGKFMSSYKDAMADLIQIVLDRLAAH